MARKHKPEDIIGKPPAPKARDRVLTDDELAEVWSAVGQLADPWGPFYRLAILTGQRREEVAALRWSELHRETKEWAIPAERTKNGVAHIVPLSEAVVAELDDIAAGAWPRAGYVLTTTGRTPVSGLSKAKRALDAKVFELRQKAAVNGVQVEGASSHPILLILALRVWRLAIWGICLAWCARSAM